MTTTNEIVKNDNRENWVELFPAQIAPKFAEDIVELRQDHFFLVMHLFKKSHLKQSPRQLRTEARKLLKKICEEPAGISKNPNINPQRLYQWKVNVLRLLLYKLFLNLDFKIETRSGRRYETI